mmetsp:Transcript_20604/g.50552  ORF Transcript_20604/g.50552 Transcript_20604/m.50552 type:complete len:95 (-) Transcript_20604:1038-1322(-)
MTRFHWLVSDSIKISIVTIQQIYNILQLSTCNQNQVKRRFHWLNVFLATSFWAIFFVFHEPAYYGWRLVLLFATLNQVLMMSGGLYLTFVCPTK